jgi:hypothetical protein
MINDGATFQILFGAFAVDANRNPRSWYRPFAYGRSQYVDGCSRATRATRCHTDLPRPCTDGMPKGWELTIERVCVLCDREPTHPNVQQFCKDAHIEMNVAGRQSFSLPLRLGEQSLVVPTLLPEIWPYDVDVKLEASHEMLRATRWPVDVPVSMSMAQETLPRLLDEMHTRGARPLVEGWFKEAVEEILYRTPHHYDSALFWVFLIGPGKVAVV